MTDDVERIAKGLTKAQRDLLSAIAHEGFVDWKARKMPGNVRTRDKLATLGLTDYWSSGPTHCYFMRRASPLGQQVRQYLERNS